MKTLRMLLSLFTVFLTLSGCSHQEDGQKNGGEVAAVVNGVEITQHEVNYLSHRSAAPNASPEVAQNQRRAILADLVRSELLAQKAHAMKLDKTPDFTLAMYEARRKVLAGLAQQELASQVSPVTPEVARKIVANNPRLFAKRKFLVYDEVLIPIVDEPLLKALTEKADNGASLNQLLDELNAKKVRFRRAKRAVASNQIQPAILKVLSKAKQGKPLVVRVGDKFSMLLMLDTIAPVPLVGDAATRSAQMMLMAQRRNAAISKGMATMLNSAKISYFGEYAEKYDGKRKLSALPTPDKRVATKSVYRKFVFGGIISVSFISAMMFLTASMQILLGEPWLPRLWPDSKKGDEERSPYEEPYSAYLFEKLYVFLIGLAVIAGLVFELLTFWPLLPVWGSIVAVVSGVLLGTLSSQILGMDKVQNWSQKAHLLLVAVFAMPIAFGVIAILRYIHL
ncbi:MAG TPA: peptidyl-prolyl cis-trans isomerase, EpsD family [Chlorobaculum parvum]|uniref:Peptidyl-prolyl cis-trans isomerase, EpsD family n=1 Tax=Chlorobaculum parvum TaxID=274539 RepID=A0A7C5DEW3_9CHLB|nr:peptidyl-prolyl cis-trans isomerase, EpsD family [Chlorobaculum parvum]